MGARDPLTFAGRGDLELEGVGESGELEGVPEGVGVTEGSGISWHVISVSQGVHTPVIGSHSNVHASGIHP